MSAIIIDKLITLLLLMAVGFFLRKLGIFDVRVEKGLSALLTKALLPAFAISGLQRPYSSENVPRMGGAIIGLTLIVAVGAVLAVLFCALIKKCFTKNEAGVFISSIAFGNFIFLGKPLLEALYGDALSFFFAMLSFWFNILSFSVGVFLINWGRETQGGRLRGAIRAAVNPITVCSVVGILFYFFSIELPHPVRGTLDMLADAMIPLSMLLIGSSLYGASIREILTDWKIYAICCFRMVLCPLMIYLIVRPLTQDIELFHALLIISAMPVAATVGILAEQYDSPYKALATKSIVVSTVLCFITLPLLLLVFGL